MNKYVVKPSIKLFPGEELKKSTVLSHENLETGISQELKDLVLTTKVSKKSDYDGRPSEEVSTITTTFKVGDRLLFSNEEGYFYPPYKMMSVKEVIDDFECIKEV